MRALTLVTGLIAAAAIPAHAATPASGSINDTQHAVEWTGGPTIVPNPTLLLTLADQQPVCEEGTPTCDVFRFDVNLAAADLDNDAVVITIGWEHVATAPGDAAAIPDYDIVIYDDATGEVVREQISLANPEVITLTAVNRKYRVEVFSFGDGAEPFQGRAEYVPFVETGRAAGVVGGGLGGGFLLALACLGLARRRV